MHRSGSESSFHSACRNSDDDDVKELSIQGSPAPRALRRCRPVRTRPSQPPNSPAQTPHLPIDQIMKLRADLNKRLEDGCGFNSERACSRASSHPELAIDLSSIADSYSTSAISSGTSSCDESEWSPARPHQKNSAAHYSQYSPLYTQSRMCDTNQKVQPIYRTQQENSKSGRSDSCYSRCSCRSKQPSHSADLIRVYVDTVNNAELSKFFRPCITCDKINCECFRIEECEQPYLPSCPTSCEKCNLRYCGCFPLNSSTRGHSSHASNVSFCETNRYDKNIAEQAVDSGNSTLQLTDSSREMSPAKRMMAKSERSGSSGSGILSRDHVSLSVMQLATAAQCARILADSLESVLQLARDEISDGTDTSRGTSTASAQPSLQSALSALTENQSK